jgi:hypothetical protein
MFFADRVQLFSGERVLEVDPGETTRPGSQVVFGKAVFRGFVG